MTIEPVLAARFSIYGLKADEVCRINSEKPDVHRGAKLGWKIRHFSIYAFYRKDNVKQALT